MSNTYIENLINSDPRFQAILSMPDEQFDVGYNKISGLWDSIFLEAGVQDAAMHSAQMVGEYDKQVGEEVLQEILDEIQTLDYSENKKAFLTDLMKKSAGLTVEKFDNPRAKIPVKIFKLNSDAILPEYAHPLDAGADISASEEVKIEAGETKLVPTGLAVAIPAGYEIQIRPRSGLSLKSGLRIANSPATIDSDYRGEIKVIMTNTDNSSYTIEKGAKIAQMLIAETPMIKWFEVESEEELGSTKRGAGGFGSTDSKS